MRTCWFCASDSDGTGCSSLPTSLALRTCCRVSPSSPLVSPSKSPLPPGICPPVALDIALTRSGVDDCRLPFRRDILPPSLCHRIDANPSVISLVVTSFSVPSPCEGSYDCSGPSVGSISFVNLGTRHTNLLLSCVFSFQAGPDRLERSITTWPDCLRLAGPGQPGFGTRLLALGFVCFVNNFDVLWLSLFPPDMNLPISDRICGAVDDLEMVSGKNAVNKGETSVVAVTHSRFAEKSPSLVVAPVGLPLELPRRFQSCCLCFCSSRNNSSCRMNRH